MIKVIFFDVWNTLYYYTPEKKALQIHYLTRGITGQLHNLGIIKDGTEIENRVMHVLYSLKNVYDKPIEYQLDIILKKIGIQVNKIHFKQILKAYLQSMLIEPPELFPNVKDVLSILNEKHDLGVISNTGKTPGRIIRKYMKKDGILQLFKILVFSDEIRMGKPNPNIFRYALQELKAKPEECIFVGDDPISDIFGAKSIGMQVVLFDVMDLGNTTPHKPHYIIKDLSDLLPIIKMISSDKPSVQKDELDEKKKI